MNSKIRLDSKCVWEYQWDDKNLEVNKKKKKNLRWFLFRDLYLRDLGELEIVKKNGQIIFSFNNFLGNSNEPTDFDTK